MRSLLVIEEDNPRIEVQPEYAWIWRAWQRLSADRPLAIHGAMMPMGGGIIRSIERRIPWTVVMKWAAWHELDRAETGLLDLCICALDAIYIARTNDGEQNGQQGSA